MQKSSLLAAMVITASANYDAPDYILNPEPWARGSTYKGSGTGKTGINVPKSRAKAKAARKARRKARNK